VTTEVNILTREIPFHGKGEFVVMPDHFHVMIGIYKNEYNSQWDVVCRDAMPCVFFTKEY